MLPKTMFLIFNKEVQYFLKDGIVLFELLHRLLQYFKVNVLITQDNCKSKDVNSKEIYIRKTMQSS